MIGQHTEKTDMIRFTNHAVIALIPDHLKTFYHFLIITTDSKTEKNIIIFIYYTRILGLGGKCAFFHFLFFIKSSKMIKFPKNVFLVKNMSIQHIPL